MSAVDDRLAQALDSPDARVDDVLDIVDAEIERAAGARDGPALNRLATLLGTVASDRGRAWRPLAIAAARARVLAELNGVSPAAPAQQAPAQQAPAQKPAARQPAPQQATAAPQPVRAPEAPPPGAAEPKLVYGGWWRRVVALLLDFLVVGLILSLLDGTVGYSFALLVIVGVAYFAGLPALLDGVTAGKGAMGLAIRVDGGKRIGFGRALVRALALAGLWITFVGAIADVIVAGTDARRQAVHDKIAGTIVVRTRPS